MSFGSLVLSLERPRLNRLKRAFMAEVVRRMRSEQADKGKRLRNEEGGGGRRGGEGKWKGRKRIGKENVHAASRRVRPPLAFLLSPCLATNHTRSSQHLYRLLYPPFILRPNRSTTAQRPSYALARATAYERNDSVAVDRLTPRSPWSKVFRLLQ